MSEKTASPLGNGGRGLKLDVDAGRAGNLAGIALRQRGAWIETSRLSTKCSSK